MRSTYDAATILVVPPPKTIAVGDGLVLRCHSLDDAEEMRRVIEESREHLRPFMPWASTDPNTFEARIEWLHKAATDFEAGTTFNYAVTVDDAIIGGGGIRPIDDARASIGYWMHPGHTGRGHATRAAKALRDAVLHAGFTTVVLTHDEANVASRRIAELCDFTFVRAEAHSIEAPGQTGTSWVWEYSPSTVRP
jgi:RimJ/RimL family protein N-acetyltransferase